MKPNKKARVNHPTIHSYSPEKINQFDYFKNNNYVRLREYVFKIVFIV